MTHRQRAAADAALTGVCGSPASGSSSNWQSRIFRDPSRARASRQRKEHGPAGGSCSSIGLAQARRQAPRPACRYSGAPAIATGTSVPVLGAGFAQVTVPRTLAPWARAWDSVMVSFSWSLGALRASFHVATLLATP